MILLIDNYDSFTYNLVQLLRESGPEVRVVRNDAISVDEVLVSGASGIVLSPGPGRPESAGICLSLLEARADLPILGVCLGHQCLGMSFGATVDRAAELMHGKTSRVRHDGDQLFDGLPSPFQATRYHSLAVIDGSVPEALQPIAWSEDDTIMALRHRQLPYWGVQFHPESVLTHSGVAMLRNFLRLCGEPVTATPPSPLITSEGFEAEFEAEPEAELTAVEVDP